MFFCFILIKSLIILDIVMFLTLYIFFFGCDSASEKTTPFSWSIDIVRRKRFSILEYFISHLLRINLQKSIRASWKSFPCISRCSILSGKGKLLFSSIAYVNVIVCPDMFSLSTLSVKLQSRRYINRAPSLYGTDEDCLRKI